jgi:hypothetical protein
MKGWNIKGREGRMVENKGKALDPRGPWFDPWWQYFAIFQPIALKSY